MEARLKQIIQVCTERDAPIAELETMPTTCTYSSPSNPQYGIHQLVEQIKARSSRLLREEHPYLRSKLPTLWTNPYLVATVGRATLEIVKRYVQNQRNA
ncbi:MAG: REP-associated tyrosine transposase [Pseudonocardiales bacterium]|jgi:putative transposase|nr:REP-associated tyrosine transposase [Pseudonocardiales bacterium]MDT7748251.1 REP-associated tyrosine transposase [Pseudonocardiales bacterium]